MLLRAKKSALQLVKQLLIIFDFAMVVSHTISSMIDLTDDERREVLGELLMDELRGIREGIDRLNGLPAQAQTIDTRLSSVESDVTVIKAVTKDISKQLTNHDKDIRFLKARMA